MKFSTLLTGALLFAAPMAHAQYVEVYGGASVGGQDLNYGPVPPAAPNLQQMDAGPVFGGGSYWSVPGTPFQLGGDAMLTNQDYATWGPGSNLSTASVMMNGRYHMPLPPSFQAYVGLGLGGIQLNYDDPLAALDGTDTIFGYQAELGLTYQIGAYPAFAAIKYQAGFDEGLIQTESVEYNSLSLIGGVRF